MTAFPKSGGSLEPLISSLAAARLREAKKISGPRPPDPDRAGSHSLLLREISRLRGRDLYYPYVSSGLGNGPFVQLTDGSVKLDFICGIGAHILGHSHPEIVKAGLRAAMEDGAMQGHLQMSGVYKEALEKLLSLAGKSSRLRHGWICPSGSMANENALKAIRQKKPGARLLIAFEGAFAGRTGLMASITDNPLVREGLPDYNETLRIPFFSKAGGGEPALSALKKHYREKGPEIACFMAELMQGDGGCRRAPREFFLPLFEFCRQKGIAVWADEIQTFGRSGEFFAFERLGLGDYVDVCSVGKALQMSASLWTREYNPRPGLVAGTFAAASSSFHSALAVLRVLEKGYMGPRGRISQIYEGWTGRLKRLEAEGLLSEIEGWGLMMGAAPLEGRPEQLSRLLQILFQEGLICFSCGHGARRRLRFLLPAAAEESHLDLAFDILRRALRQLKAEDPAP